MITLRGLTSWLESLTASRCFAYTTIFIVQLKTLWDIWLYRDLSSGDTALYYFYATLWHTETGGVLWFSPLYTALFSMFQSLTPDAYTVTILHRMAINLAVTLLLLAVARRLLPATIAWCVAAWWAILPINYDVFFEVHLFAAIPILIVLLVVSQWPTPWGRGAALALLVGTMCLVRNEFAIPVVVWALICFLHDVLHARHEPHPVRALTYLKMYGLPLAAALILVAAFYIRSHATLPQLAEAFALKHTRNVCQVYAYSYREHFHDWTQDPWSHCDDLMLRDFGLRQPSFLQAFARNPAAMLRFMRWNVRLIPDGIQALLFGATAGSLQPDYLPVRTRWLPALVLSVAAGVVIILGATLLWRHRHYWWSSWLEARVWTWAALLSVTILTIVIMVTQRPRPEYLYGFAFFAMLLVGMCIFVIAVRWPWWSRLRPLFPVAVILVLVAVPVRFTRDYRNADGSATRELHERYRRLAPFQKLIQGPNTRLLAHGWAQELCLYMATHAACQGVEFGDFLARRSSQPSLGRWLDEQSISLVYVDEYAMSQAETRRFLHELDESLWRTVAYVDGPSQRWRLLRRTPPE